MNFQISLAQINPALGDLARNLEMHMQSIDEAIGAGSQVIVFPELSLTGYFLRDQVFELARPLDCPALKKLLARSKDISIAVGFVELDDHGRCYNSMAFLEDGKILHVHRKVHLVTYGMFDDAREFAAGSEFKAINSKYGRLGLMLCEDLWHSTSAFIYFLNDVDALLVASAGPGRGVSDSAEGLESALVWQTMLRSSALHFQTWTTYTNRVGWEDGILFAGGSCIFDPFGKLVSELPQIDTGRLDQRLDSATQRRARYITPLRRDTKPWILERALQDFRDSQRASSNNAAQGEQQ